MILLFIFARGGDSHRRLRKEKELKRGGGIFEDNCDCRDF